jgi:hypothetical protein
MATATQSLSGGTCNSRSYPILVRSVLRLIGPLYLKQHKYFIEFYYAVLYYCTLKGSACCHEW